MKEKASAGRYRGFEWNKSQLGLCDFPLGVKTPTMVVTSTISNLELRLGDCKLISARVVRPL